MKTPFTIVSSSSLLLFVAGFTFSAKAAPLTFDRTVTANVTQVQVTFRSTPYQLDIPLGTPVTLDITFTGVPIANADGSLTLGGSHIVPGNSLNLGLSMPIAFDAAQGGPRIDEDESNSGGQGVILFPDGTFTLNVPDFDGLVGFDNGGFSLTRSGQVSFTAFDNVGGASIGITAQVPDAFSTLWGALPIALL
ncbi:MAG TPA: hypothetical protein VGH08_03880, partial [Chthoniobacterales bacterium]